jgi:hypothetical protein
LEFIVVVGRFWLALVFKLGTVVFLVDICSNCFDC